MLLLQLADGAQRRVGACEFELAERLPVERRVGARVARLDHAVEGLNRAVVLALLERAQPGVVRIARSELDLEGPRARLVGLHAGGLGLRASGFDLHLGLPDGLAGRLRHLRPDSRDLFGNPVRHVVELRDLNVEVRQVAQIDLRDLDVEVRETAQVEIERVREWVDR